MKKPIALLPLCLLLSAPAGSAQRKSIRLATTTSVENTGLLDVLLPAFERKSGVRVLPVAVGTGKALKLAENGDADVLLVHDPEAEKEFLARGFGTDRTTLFYNEFLLAGPTEDPAGVKGSKDAAEAFRKIAAAKSPFVSRGDKSGTHSRELSIWKKAGVEPQAPWYLESGQGMGPTLVIAGEKKAYCLCDSATFASFSAKTGLAQVYAGDPTLLNEYSVILAKGAGKDSKAFLKWMGSKEARKLVAGFKKDGKLLFRLEK
ncbi:MAG TPA: hypothetical protein DCM05_15740 [Elusimicrobia bacterium]|nr:hypothetical protein [Elusimicrobiota bacterium]